MNSNEGVLISVADVEMGAAITTNIDLLSSAPVSFLLARNYITVDSARHASVQGHIQIPSCEDKVLFLKKTKKTIHTVQPSSYRMYRN